VLTTLMTAPLLSLIGRRARRSVEREPADLEPSAEST
jgi:hypothetical protein